jgi:hypothetical protein
MALATLVREPRLDKLVTMGLARRRVLKRSATALASLLIETRLSERRPDDEEELLLRLLRRSATALAIASKSTLGILSLLIDVDSFSKARSAFLERPGS